MLDAGDITAYFADRAILSDLAGMSGEADKLRIADQYLSIEPYALALPRGDSDFRLAVDRALSHIYKSGEIAAVFSNRLRRADAADRYAEDPLYHLRATRMSSRDLRATEHRRLNDASGLI